MRAFALALSGGGILGAAHLGALQYMEEQGVRAAAVAGTSAGGLAAGLYALGVPVSQVIELGQRIAAHPLHYFHTNTVALLHDVIPALGPPATGLVISDTFIKALLKLHPAARTTDDWILPAIVTAVDVVSLKAIAFTNRPGVKPGRGHWEITTGESLRTALAATMAMPGLFAGPRRAGQVLIDGGTADNLPVDWAFALHPDCVVAIDVGGSGSVSADRMGITEVLARAERYATKTLSTLRAGPEPHLLVAPDTSGTPFPGFSHFDHLVQAGRQAMAKAWPAIEAL